MGKKRKLTLSEAKNNLELLTAWLDHVVKEHHKGQPLMKSDISTIEIVIERYGIKK